jgi:hypothetical protein
MKNETDTNDRQLRIPPLSRSAEEFLAKRKLKSRRTLNDEVETVYLALINDEQFQGYLEAVYDEDAVEGSLSIDNMKAAEMIRAKALEMEIVAVSKRKLATIVKAMNVVLRRGNDDRNTRRYMLHGEVDPPAPSPASE